MSEQDQLPFPPPGWVQTSIGEIAEPGRERVNPPSFTELPYISLEHIEAHTMRLLGTVASSSMSSSAVHFYPNDVLYARLRPYLNKVYRPDFEGLCSSEFIVFPANSYLSSKFLQYLLNSSSLVTFASHSVTGDRPRIDFDQLSRFQVLLPPLAEQQRIVDEIDKQFSRLEATVEILQRVKRNLERLRMATLRAAVEGRLVPTEADLARAEGRSYESADLLLQIILRERRVRWEADQLAKMKEQGKTPKDNKWKESYPEPVSPNTDSLPVLPEGWVWASVDQSLIIIDYRGRTPPFSESGFPHLRSSNVRNGKIVWEGLAYISEETYEAYMTRGLPDDGDLLFTTEAPLGEVALAPTGKKFSVAQRMMILRPMRGLLSSTFLMYQIMASEFQRFIRQRGTGSTVLGVSSRNFRPTPIRIPPIAEQDRIADEVGRRLSVIEELKTLVTNALRRATILRQKILSAAFAGKLVPQDPTDEPASILLKRIRAEKAEREAKAQQSRKERREKMKGSSPKTTKRKPRRPLRETIADSKQRITPEQLFTEAGFTLEVVEDFYEELRHEINAGHIKQVRPDNAKVYLIAASA